MIGRSNPHALNHLSAKNGCDRQYGMDVKGTGRPENVISDISKAQS